MFLIIIITVFSSSLANETVADDEIFDPESVFGTTPTSNLDFVGTANYYGFDVETHYVKTRDGYILTVFRIVWKGCYGVDMEPLAFMHGLFLSGNTCILRGEDSHCFVYAINCFDVWVPNMRGNQYSRNHTTLDPDKDMAFWNYDFDQKATEDVPAVLDYIIKVTGKPQIIIVGHSQGVIIVLILCALRPEYNIKIKILFALSTSSWLFYSRVFILDIEAVLAPGITVGSELGFHREIIKNGGLLSKLALLLCGLTTITYPVCSAFVFAFFGYNNNEITPNVLIDTVHKEPSGSSTDLFGRWGEVKTDGLTQKDYGYFKNLVIYGRPTPPGYPFENVTCDVFFISSDNDYVSHPKDLARLRSNLTNSRHRTCHLRNPYFGHLDFVVGKSAKAFCVDLIMAYSKNGSTAECQGDMIEG